MFYPFHFYFTIYLQHVMKCADCNCVKDLCKNVNFKHCYLCTKEECCCLNIHTQSSNRSLILTFLHYTRTLFAAALGIEILCISAAEIGENSTFYFFGYHSQGIVLGYIIGYLAAGFTTFMTILGRYDLRNTKIDSCCSVLDQQSNKGFLPNLLITFKNFGLGIYKLSSIHRQSNIKHILKTSLIILVTAETVCILTAETVDLIFYKQSMLLSIPLALLAGSLAVVLPEAYKKTKIYSGLG
jgi:hypothetical protein